MEVRTYQGFQGMHNDVAPRQLDIATLSPIIPNQVYWTPQSNHTMPRQLGQLKSAYYMRSLFKIPRPAA